MSWFGDEPSAMWGRVEDDSYGDEDPYEDPAVTRGRTAKKPRGGRFV